MNLKLSINRISKLIEMICSVFFDLYWSTFIFFEDKMYSLSAEGIQLIVPLVSDNCFIKKIITLKIVKDEK